MTCVISVALSKVQADNDAFLWLMNAPHLLYLTDMRRLFWENNGSRKNAVGYHAIMHNPTGDANIFS